MITVNDLLKCFDQSEITVIAGQNGLHRDISSTTVLDAPDGYEWLRGKELILTSGFIFEDNGNALKNFIENLIQTGCSGVGIKLGRFVHEFPEEVKILADEHEFPIIKIPYRFVWTDIISPFYNLKYNHDESRPIKVEPEMIATAFEASRWSSIGLLRQLTSFFKIPMALVKSNNEPSQLNDIDGTRHILNFLKNNPTGALLELENQGNNYKTIDGQYFLAHPISFTNKKSAEYIIATSTSESTLRELHKLFNILDDISRGSETQSTEKHKMYQNFMYKVISGKITPHEIADFERNRNLKGTVYSGFILIVAPNYEELYAQIKEIVRHFRFDVNTHMVYNSFANEAVVFIEYHQIEDRNYSSCFFCQLLVEVDERLYTNDGFIACGSMYDSLKHIRNSYDEAVQAKELGRMLWKHQHVYSYGMLSPYLLLGQENLAQVDLSDVTLLERSRQRLGFDGLETTEMFLEIGNYKKAAEKLYIHENTLRHRIQKISELLHLHLSNPLLCHSFLLKIKLWRIQNS